MHTSSTPIMQLNTLNFYKIIMKFTYIHHIKSTCNLCATITILQMISVILNEITYSIYIL